MNGSTRNLLTGEVHFPRRTVMERRYAVRR